MTRFLISAAFLGAFAAVASAQTIVVNPRQPMAPVSAELIRVTIGISTFVTAPPDNSEESLKAQEGGRRMIYELAAHECALLLNVLASDCRIESLNVNVQRAPANQFAAQQRAEGFNLNGNIVFRIAPK